MNVKSKFAMTGQLIVNRLQVFPALQLQLQLKMQDKVIIKLYNVMMTVEILQEVLETLKINGCIPCVNAPLQHSVKCFYYSIYTYIT